MLRTTLLTAVVAVLLTAGGQATAARLLSGKDVRNNSLTGKDVRNGSLAAGDLSAAARRSLRGARGAVGPAGAAGPAGLTGPAGPAGKDGAAGRNGRTAVVYLPGQFGNVATGEQVVASMPLPQGTWLVEVNVVANQPSATPFIAGCDLKRGATQLASASVPLDVNPDSGLIILDAPVTVPAGGATIDVVCQGPGGGKDVDYTAGGWATSVDDLTIVGG